MLSPDAKILAVATISEVKVFFVRRRKGDDRGTLRIHKLDVPGEISDDGARLVTISPDSKWLCVVRPNSDIYLARIKLGSPQEKPQILPQLVKPKRSVRHTRFEKASHGSLGDYERTIRCAVFSEDSKILAFGDLSGCVDTFVLEDAADSASKTRSKTNKASESDDDSDDEDDDLPVIEGQLWHAAATESPIPRLKSGIVLMSFRPKSQPEQKYLTNSTDHAPQPSDSRLMVLTSEHQLIEFDAVEGKLSDWSRKNPKAYLPAEFRGVKDRAMGCVWDLSEGRDRLWLYGTSWLWMFDLKQDFPSPEELEASETSHDKETQPNASSHKRKRSSQDDDEENARKKKPNSGAGDRMSVSESAMFIGSHRVRQIVGADESQAEWITLDDDNRRTDGDGEGEEEYDNDEAFTTANDTKLAQLRREASKSTHHQPQPASTSTSTPQKPSSLKHNKSLLPLATGLTDTPTTRKILGHDDMDTPQKAVVPAEDTSQYPPRRWWHTYKYRDILGIVPLSSFASLEEDSESEDNGEDGEAGADNKRGGLSTFEVAVVERPMWDVDLPGRYLRDYE